MSLYRRYSVLHCHGYCHGWLDQTCKFKCMLFVCSLCVLCVVCMRAGLFPYPALSDAEVLAAVKGGVGFELECPNQCDQQM